MWVRHTLTADKCDSCLECIAPCPMGAIDSWRTMPRAKAYNVNVQQGWTSLPIELTDDELAAEGITTGAEPAVTTIAPALTAAAARGLASSATHYGTTLPPWSAAHAYTNLYGPGNPVTATVVGNMRVTRAGHEYDTHHIVLDLGREPFPVLEGQSVGVIAPGTDAAGRPHHARQYSVSSPRAADLAALLADPDSYFYVCGLRSMEEGVVLALRDIAEQVGLRWEVLGPDLKRQARLHLETYCVSSPGRWRDRTIGDGPWGSGTGVTWNMTPNMNNATPSHLTRRSSRP